jgi:hypothetical protein
LIGGAGKLFRGFAIKVVGAHIAVPFRFQLQDFSATAERVRVASANGREPASANSKSIQSARGYSLVELNSWLRAHVSNTSTA